MRCEASRCWVSPAANLVRRLQASVKHSASFLLNNALYFQTGSEMPSLDKVCLCEKSIELFYDQLYRPCYRPAPSNQRNIVLAFFVHTVEQQLGAPEGVWLLLFSLSSFLLCGRTGIKAEEGTCGREGGRGGLHRQPSLVSKGRCFIGPSRPLPSLSTSVRDDSCLRTFALRAPEPLCLRL